MLLAHNVDRSIEFAEQELTKYREVNNRAVLQNQSPHMNSGSGGGVIQTNH